MPTIKQAKPLTHRQKRHFWTLRQMLFTPAMRVLLASILVAGASQAQAQVQAYPFVLEAYDETGTPVVAEIYRRDSGSQWFRIASGGRFTLASRDKPDALYGKTNLNFRFSSTSRVCDDVVHYADDSLDFLASYTPGGFDNVMEHNKNSVNYGGTVGVCYVYGGGLGAGRPVMTRIFSGSAKDAAGNWLVFDHIAEPLVEIYNDCTPDYDVRGPAITLTKHEYYRSRDYSEPAECAVKITAKAIYRHVSAGPDADGDLIPDDDDNCPTAANQKQNDADQDGIGDLCDSVYEYDSDLDGVMDAVDNCPYRANSNQADHDQDGLGDVCDPDKDGDGFVNEEADFYSSMLSGLGISSQVDNCPWIANPDQLDADGDGRGDTCHGFPPGC